MTNFVKTIHGRKKRIEGYMSSTPTLSPITHIAVGDGGQNADGSLKIPSESASGLYNEVLRQRVEYERVSDAVAKFVAVLNSGNDTVLNGKKINEIGLIDSDGTLITLETFNLFGNAGFPVNSIVRLKTQIIAE
ncbi:MAG: phage tail protein [Paraclostridium sp.]